MTTTKVFTGFKLILLLTMILSITSCASWHRSNRQALIDEILNGEEEHKYIIHHSDNDTWEKKKFKISKESRTNRVFGSSYHDIQIHLVEPDKDMDLEHLKSTKKTKFRRFKHGIKATYYFDILDCSGEEKISNTKEHVMTVYIFKSLKRDAKGRVFQYFIEHKNQKANREHCHFDTDAFIQHQSTQGGGREVP